MSRGTIDIYEYLHQKSLLQQDDTKWLDTNNSCLSRNAFRKNGIEFRKCRMILAIQNKAQLEHAKSHYPTENEHLLKDQGEYWNIQEISKEENPFLYLSNLL